MWNYKILWGLVVVDCGDFFIFGDVILGMCWFLGLVGLISY